MRTFVIGDIHGQHKALVECLKAAGFDNDRDKLIALGDVCDRGPKVRECIDELLKITHLVYLLGNHDAWTLEWAAQGVAPREWLDQGGAETVAAYKGMSMPGGHIALLTGAPLSFEEGGRVFVHAGFDPRTPIDQQSRELLIWDRELVTAAWEAHRSGKERTIPGCREVFVGHTPTIFLGGADPVHIGNLWLMDTGAGYGYRLTIMDVETKQFWQAGCLE